MVPRSVTAYSPIYGSTKRSCAPDFAQREGKAPEVLRRPTGDADPSVRPLGRETRGNETDGRPHWIRIVNSEAIHLGGLSYRTLADGGAEHMFPR